MDLPNPSLAETAIAVVWPMANIYSIAVGELPPGTVLTDPSRSTLQERQKSARHRRPHVE